MYSQAENMRDENRLSEAQAKLDECLDGEKVLNDVRRFIGQFCAFPSTACLDALTLWAAHAHMVQHFHTTPRLAMLSPEPGSGKTRVLEILDLLTPQAMLILSPSVAAIFRKLMQDQVTLLFDECDTIFSRRGKNDQNEDLRALINSGYRRGAKIPRCVGPKHNVQDFPVYAAAALAGLGDLPDTIMSRAVVIRMRKRTSAEHIEPFRARSHEEPGHALRDRLAEWASAIGAAAGVAWPDLPPGVQDRKAEVWEPLIAIADEAGGHWPETSRKACTDLCTAAESNRASLGVCLLDDLKTIFGDVDALHTETILARLCGTEPYATDEQGEPVYIRDDAPWAQIRGKPIDARAIARLLAKYGVRSKKVKVAGRALQGYRREDLWDPWQRYVSLVPAEPEPAEPVEPDEHICSAAAGNGVPSSVTVPEPSRFVEPDNALTDKESSAGSRGSGLAGIGGRAGTNVESF